MIRKIVNALTPTVTSANDGTNRNYVRIAHLLFRFLYLVVALPPLLRGPGVLWGQVPAQPPTISVPNPYPRPNPLLPTPTPPAPTPAAAPKSDVERFRQWRLWNKPQGFTVDQDHEDAGLMIVPGSQSSYSGIYAKHIVYPEDAFTLSLPSDATRQQTLYAATTRPPNGSCLEVGTAYTTQPSANPAAIKTFPVLYVYDFCAPAGGNFAIGPTTTSNGILIDQLFLDKYTKPADNGRRAYEIEIFTKDFPISASTTWYAQILNQQTSKWETLYSDHGLADDNRGWSIFETYYQKGMCPESLPILGADQISLFDSRRGAWQLVTKEMPLLTLSIDQGGVQNNNCFVADSTGPASYSVLPVPPIYYSWSVESQQKH
jgi:hypothetical protein